MRQPGWQPGASGRRGRRRACPRRGGVPCALLCQRSQPRPGARPALRHGARGTAQRLVHDGRLPAKRLGGPLAPGFRPRQRAARGACACDERGARSARARPRCTREAVLVFRGRGGEPLQVSRRRALPPVSEAGKEDLRRRRVRGQPTGIRRAQDGRACALRARTRLRHAAVGQRLRGQPLRRRPHARGHNSGRACERRLSRSFGC